LLGTVAMSYRSHKHLRRGRRRLYGKHPLWR